MSKLFVSFLVFVALMYLMSLLQGGKEGEGEGEEQSFEDQVESQKNSIISMYKENEFIDIDHLQNEVSSMCQFFPNEDGNCNDHVNTELIEECCIPTEYASHSFAAELGLQFALDMGIELFLEFIQRKFARPLARRIGRPALVQSIKTAGKKMISKAVKKITQIATKRALKIAVWIATKAKWLAFGPPGWFLFILEIVAELTVEAMDVNGYNLDVDHYTILSLRNNLLYEMKNSYLQAGVPDSLYPIIHFIFDDSYFRIVPSLTNSKLFEYIITHYIKCHIKQLYYFIYENDETFANRWVASLFGIDVDGEASFTDTNDGIDYDETAHLVFEEAPDFTEEEEEKLSEYSVLFLDKNPQERDKFFHRLLEDKINEEYNDSEAERMKSYFKCYEELSGPISGRMAVSLSEIGCEYFNNMNRTKIMEGITKFNPSTDDEEVLAIPVVHVADTTYNPKTTFSRYRTDGIGTIDVRDVEMKQLPGKGCFGYPFATIWNFCEDKKEGGVPMSFGQVDDKAKFAKIHAKILNGTATEEEKKYFAENNPYSFENLGEDFLNILSGQTSLGELDPYADGVRFDLQNMRCVYTEEFCESTLGISYDRDKKSCYISAGSTFLETVVPFGKEISRAVGKFANDVDKWFGKCDYDNNDWLNPGECCMNVSCEHPKSCYFCEYGSRFDATCSKCMTEYEGRAAIEGTEAARACSLLAGDSDKAKAGYGRGCWNWDGDGKNWCYTDNPRNYGNQLQAAGKGGWSEEAGTSWKKCDPASNLKPTQQNCWKTVKESSKGCDVERSHCNPHQMYTICGAEYGVSEDGNALGERCSLDTDCQLNAGGGGGVCCQGICTQGVKEGHVYKCPSSVSDYSDELRNTEEIRRKIKVADKWCWVDYSAARHPIKCDRDQEDRAHWFKLYYYPDGVFDRILRIKSDGGDPETQRNFCEPDLGGDNFIYCDSKTPTGDGAFLRNKANHQHHKIGLDPVCVDQQKMRVQTTSYWEDFCAWSHNI